MGLTWLELGYGVTFSPRATAVLGLLMVLLAVIPALVFERRAFCHYGCLVGRICGLYSMAAPLELRARDRVVCKDCKTRDCLEGNERGYPCPTGQSLPAMSQNTYCTLCSECVKSCPHDNVAVRLRPWGSDLFGLKRPQRDEAVLALVMLSLTSFHGLTMTPAWNAILAGLRALTGLDRLGAFTLGMASILLLPAAAYLGFVKLLRRVEAGAAPRLGLAFAYPLIAVALFYHLAHNAGHLIHEGLKIVPVVSDPLGRGLDLFGTASFVPRPMASMNGVCWLQVALVVLGAWLALAAASRLATVHGLGRRGRVLVSLFLVAASCANLWLLAQPMEMRSGM